MSYQTTRFADLFTQLATKNKAGSFHSSPLAIRALIALLKLFVPW